jgi:type IV pilus assembly protein PilN
MIRVNLLPRKREAKREGGRAWIAVLAAAALIQVVVIVILHAGKLKERDDQLEQNKIVQASIDDKQAKASKHPAVKTELAEYEAREDAIAKLKSARNGPTAMLLEVSRILTPRKMPSVEPEVLEKLRRENPGAVPTDKWDPHRLWLVSFKEVDRNVTITGVGKSNEDVAEFLRRVTLSRYFTDVKLVKTEERTEKDTATAVTYTTIGFEMRAKVRY